MSTRNLWIYWTYLTCIVTFGYENLSANKNASQYIEAIGKPPNIYDAKNAVDGNNTTCMRTTDIGTTSSNNNDNHYTWWRVNLGGIYNVYNIRIQFRNYGQLNTLRQRGRFAGFSLYVSNTTEKNSGYLCYKNKDVLPPLDFNTSCSIQGRYVTYYNERLKGTPYPSGFQNSSVFTELCEVTVTGCFSSGVYGNFCNKSCPEHCRENACSIIDGTCYGCAPGWIGQHCKDTCPNGSYGSGCLNCVGHCKDNQVCNHSTGLCDNGCLDGWKGINCDQECSQGMYGSGCQKNCSENCLYDGECNRTTGKCDAGCKPGYKGAVCDTGCENGTFGRNCTGQCSGHCLYNAFCNSTDGSCVHGCAPGFFGIFCNKTCDNKNVGCTQNCSINDSCHCLNGQKKNHDCNDGMDKNDENNEAAVIGGATAGGTCVIILSIIGIFFLRKRRNKKQQLQEETDSVVFSAMDDSLNKGKRKQINGNRKNIAPVAENKELGKLNTKTSKNLQSLTKFLSEIEYTKMEKEYKVIPKGELHLCVEGKRQENLSKNRYKTILPYDHSRVVLDTLTNESDYVNANYIEDTLVRKTYIATQGPRPSTVVDFWRMVWQKNARVIVCLTNISEADTKKCAKYWPDLNDKHMEGCISIRCQKEQTYAENVVRHLRIHNTSDKTERDVFMFHYTQWPDHGVPEPLSLVVFHRHVMKTVKEHPMGYIVVHCSAGIGRTGTFIALDALYKEGERTGKVNVPQYVEKMRNDRMNMIQGEDQYKTVYMALLEAFRGRLRAVPVDFFLKEFQDHSCYLNHGDVSKISPFALEFEELLSFKKVYTHDDYKSGMSNIAANYVPSVLPIERYLCPLPAENLYYNAVCLQSFTRCDRFISAQFPLPDYTEHFLTLVKTYYTCTIVSLYPLGEVKSTSFWLPTKNQQKTVGPFTIKLAESTEAKYVTKTNITLQQKGGSSTRVAVLECRGWEDEYDSKSRRILIDLVQEAKIEERTHPTGRILVLSSDGAKRCGPFCAVFNALEQMMMDEEVDLFTITRQLQTRRPEFLSSLEEYQFCFDTISDYLQNDTLYANV